MKKLMILLIFALIVLVGCEKTPSEITEGDIFRETY